MHNVSTTSINHNLKTKQLYTNEKKNNPKPQLWTKKLHQVKFRPGKVEWVVSLLFIRLKIVFVFQSFL